MIGITLRYKGLILSNLFFLKESNMTFSKVFITHIPMAYNSIKNILLIVLLQCFPPPEFFPPNFIQFSLPGLSTTI